MKSFKEKIDEFWKDSVLTRGPITYKNGWWYDKYDNLVDVRGMRDASFNIVDISGNIVEYLSPDKKITE